MVTEPAQTPGFAEQRAVQPVSAGLMEHWAMVAVPPVQMGSVGFAVQDASRGAQPASAGVAVHCAYVTLGQEPGLAAHRAAQPARPELAEHWAIVTVAPPVPEVTHPPEASLT